MAVSVTSRPSTWSAVKNPMVYKFSTTGGPFTNYRIEVEIFKASDDSSLTGGVKFAFSPGLDGVTYVDVSAIIKAYMKAEWIKPSALNEIEADTSLKFYIKYQELYDGSATSVIDDVANPRYGVFGALQIPSPVGNDLTNYVPADETKKFLTVFDRPKIWRGWPATLSFIFPNTLLFRLLRSQYDSQGNLINTIQDDELNEANDDAVNRIDINNNLSIDDGANTLKLQVGASEDGDELLSNPNFDSTLDPWDSAGGGDASWIWDSNEAQLQFDEKIPGSEILENPEFISTIDPWVSVDAEPGPKWFWEPGDYVRVFVLGGTDNPSEPLRQDITETPGGQFELTIRYQVNRPNRHLIISAYLGETLVEEFYNQELIVATIQDYVTPVTISGPFDRIEVIAHGEISNEQNAELILSTVSLKPYTPPAPIGSVSDPLRQDISEQPFGAYRLTLTYTGLVNSMGFRVEVHNDGTLVQTIYNQAITPAGNDVTQSYYIVITSTFDRIECYATTLNEDALLIRLKDVSLKSTVIIPYTEELPIAIENPCQNPVMLFWKNSLGGDSWWLFDYDQEQAYSLSGQKKAKRLVLFANNLTANEWEALNELNHLGEVYKKNILELTSSVNKSHVKDGTQVYVVDEDGNKTGVIVIPRNNVMFTRMKRHRFEIEIEFPEIYE